MKSRSELIDFFYRLFISAFISFLFMGLILESLEVKLNIIYFLIIIGTSLLFISFFRIILRKPLIFLGVIGVNLLLTLYMNYYHEEALDNMIIVIKDFLDWSYKFLFQLTFIHMKYIYFLLAIMSIVIALIISTFVFSKRGVAYLLTLGTGIFLYNWFNFSKSAMIYYVFYITLVLILYAYNRYFKLEKEWKKNNIIVGNRILKKWVIYSVVACSLLVLIATIAPRDIKPITWRWLDRTMQDKFPFLTEWRNAKKTSYSYGAKMTFDLSNTDLQGEYKRLGGPIEETNTLVMRVKAKEELYLKGRVKDLYTGSYWRSTWDTFSNEKSNITNNFYEDIEGELNWVEIQHEDFITSSIFSTHIPKKVRLDNGSYRMNNEGEMYRNKLILKGDSYILYYVKPYLGYNTIYDKKYLEKDEEIKYLQLPKDLPKRVLDLSEDITKDINGDYNKVKAIEKYLKDNFKYTLTPPATPHNRDFVDYFLFDLKEGYCTYFASSITVMARSIGIPARYVEGFKVSNKVGDEYLVYSNNGHAWTEIYIEGQGWMVFEATPGFGNITYAEKEEEEKEEEGETTNNNRNNIGDKEDRLRELEELSDIDMGRSEDGINYVRDKKYSSIKILKNILILFAITVSIILIFILYNILRVRKILKITEDSNDYNTLIKYYKYILNMFIILGYEMLAGETTKEFSNRINLDNNNEYSFIDVTEIYNKARYSKEKIDFEEITLIKEYLNLTEKNVINKIGLLKYLYYKYIKMAIIN